MAGGSEALRKKCFGKPLINTAGTFMKIRAYSMILAIAYLLFGVVLFYIIPKFQEMYSGYTIEPLFLARAMFAVGSLGCLCFSAMVSIVVILNDIKFHSRYPNLIFTTLLVLWVSYTPIALFYPIYEASKPISISPDKSSLALSFVIKKMAFISVNSG